MNSIITTHKLDFEACDSPYAIFGGDHKMFRIGTCEGQWTSTEDCYVIISVNNDFGNGHLEDVFEWFEFSCKRDKKNLLVVECMNERFYMHLLSKRGFIPLDAKGENVIKVFNQKAYKRLRKKGNEIIMAGSLKCV